jgi:Ca2+-binding RTX toxin-like protein
MAFVSAKKKNKSLTIGDNADDRIGGDFRYDRDGNPDVFGSELVINDEIRAGGGRDALSGGLGKNDMFGQGGDDSFTIGSSINVQRDRAFGGADNDSFRLENIPAPGAGRHLINGGRDQDKLFLGQPSEPGFTGYRLDGEILGLAGGRSIARILAVEQILGSAGDDNFEWTTDVKEVQGLFGADRLKGPNGKAASIFELPTIIAGGEGSDTIIGSNANDLIFDADAGLPGNSSVPRSYVDDVDVIKGRAGIDIIYSFSKEDRIFAGSDADRVYTAGRSDTVNLGSGDDLLAFHYGTYYSDALSREDDQAARSMSIDQAILADRTFNGGADTDTIDFSRTRQEVSGGNRNFEDGLNLRLKSEVGTELGTTLNGRFTIKNFERFFLTDRNDKVDGRKAGETFFGNGGDDEIKGGGGDDVIFGDFDPVGEFASFDEGKPDGKDTLVGGAGDDTLNGGGKRDTLRGGANDDGIFGGGGADRLYGGSGTDTIGGGEGSDRMWGGSGADMFEFDLSNSGVVAQAGDVDRIFDFDVAGGDRLLLFTYRDDIKNPVTPKLTSDGLLLEAGDYDILLIGLTTTSIDPFTDVLFLPNG